MVYFTRNIEKTDPKNNFFVKHMHTKTVKAAGLKLSVRIPMTMTMTGLLIFALEPELQQF
jgi:hypothetical protein